MTPFDYDRVDWRFAARILNENSLRLSRTRQGVSDTSTSTRKKPLALSAEALRRRSAENEARVHRLVFAGRDDPPPAGPAAVREHLFAVADGTNAGLLPEGPLRTWPIGGRDGKAPKVPPADLEPAIDDFCQRVFRRWGELATDPVPLAAWAEWELNGGALHPFYDGCGRISRSFAAWLFIGGACLLPLYESREQYFAHGNRGLDVFEPYVRNRIAACDDWLRNAPAPAE